MPGTRRVNAAVESDVAVTLIEAPNRCARLRIATRSKPSSLPIWMRGDSSGQPNDMTCRQRRRPVGQLNFNPTNVSALAEIADDIATEKVNLVANNWVHVSVRAGHQQCEFR